MAAIDLKRAFSEYHVNGCTIIDNFLDDHEVEELKAAIKAIVHEHASSGEQFQTFETVNHTADEYLLESADKVRVFLEREAPSPGAPLELAVNKVGHVLHWYSEPFRRVTFSAKVKRVVREIAQFERPIVPQSMYIYKNPRIGGEVVPHQDATFLYTEPAVKLMGLWMPLEDTTTENG